MNSTQRKEQKHNNSNLVKYLSLSEFAIVRNPASLVFAHSSVTFRQMIGPPENQKVLLNARSTLSCDLLRPLRSKTIADHTAWNLRFGYEVIEFLKCVIFQSTF